MAIAEFVTYLRGSCRFAVDGSFPERFLNLAARANMGLWEIERDGDRIYARVIAGRYRKLLPFARKCGVRLHVSQKLGLPFVLIPHRKRAGMLLGFALFCGIIWLLSQFIWFVDMPQASPEVSTALTQVLDEAGVRPGTLRSRLKGELVSRELEMNIPQLSFAAVNVMGSWVSIDVREMGTLNIVLSDDQPCNVVASKNGVITSIEGFDGVTECQVGQAVAAGDLLISGVIEYSNGSVSMVHAWGNVRARTEYSIDVEIPLMQERRERSGKVITMRRLMLLGVEVPLYFSKLPEGNFEREYSEWQLDIGGARLPVMVRSEYWYELLNVNRMISYEEAETLAYEEAERQISAMEGAEIIERTQSLIRTDSGVRLTVSLKAEENIVSQVPILFGD